MVHKKNFSLRSPSSIPHLQPLECSLKQRRGGSPGLSIEQQPDQQQQHGVTEHAREEVCTLYSSLCTSPLCTVQQ